MGLDMVLYKIDKPTETENTIYFELKGKNAFPLL